MITAQHNQSLLDIAIQEKGDAAAAVLIAIENDKPVDYILLSGDVLNTDAESPANQVAVYYKARGINPATMTEEAQRLFVNGLFDNGLFE